MTVNADEVVIGAEGRVLVAPTDTAVLPTDVTAAFNAVWNEVGYLDENGVTFTDGKTVQGIPAWQSFYDIRKIVTDKSAKVDLVMRQWNEDNIKLAFGGGTIGTAGGVVTYTPPAPGDLDLRALAVEWTDGSDTFRLVFPRGMVTGEVATNIVRTKAADLPVSYEITPKGLPVAGQLATQPWYLVSNALPVT